MESITGLDLIHVNGGKSMVEDNSAVQITGNPSTSIYGEKQFVESVVYQLVRVEGDGRLVPATDDEIMEVEHMLQDCNNEPSEIEGSSKQRKTGIMPLKSHSQLMQFTADLSPGNANLDTLSEPVANDPSNTSRTSDSDISLNSKPDFSLLKEEICLDKLTIRELQETFRAAFGLKTSVKDKLWLKRRIAMGLANSCDVPACSFILKEKKMAHNKTTKEAQQQHENRKCKTVCDSMERQKNSKPAKQEKKVLSGKRSITPELDVVKSEVGNNGAKRVRKPTKRYIEELSEVDDTRESNWRLVSSDKTSAWSHTKECRSTHNVMDSSNALVTRQDSLGGSFVQIPYVSREQRRLPRKDFLTLVDGPAIEGIKVVRKSLFFKEHGPEEFKNAYPGGCQSGDDDNSDSIMMVPTSKGQSRRKHHRSWTLGEVKRLVEGVSRLGAGKWSEIKRVAFPSYTRRTSVDLKDKWRNLLKASYSQEQPTHKEGDWIQQHSRKHNNSILIPPQILLRVRELAEKQKQAGGIEFRHGKIVAKVVQENVHGFL